ncbi:hypothetical protein AB0G60_02685 [Streptomyces angustmyceticus]|uniref:Uncharacterized protein n=1 Tax=Streptomyces angustmyceticus TaxID=285578 RepID=A0A5J4L7U1_9ACTN|nr:hypothetical protein [Streptomyces angustmyceticus]UAL65570.1 hypothetical protein K7396_02660 [Streptomyces angustmyceticus]GES27911.1 hypothetical protein San01_03980 [Streptomyces angustmyceticus]
MTDRAPTSVESEIQQYRDEVSQLRAVIQELWLRVADAGSLMDTNRVRGALEGSTELSDKDYVRNAFKLPAHVRDALPGHVTQD